MILNGLFNECLLSEVHQYYHLLKILFYFMSIDPVFTSFIMLMTHICGPHFYILYVGQIIHLTTGPYPVCHLKDGPISPITGPCSVHMPHASADWMPAVPASCQIWARILCYLGCLMSVYCLRFINIITCWKSSLFHVNRSCFHLIRYADDFRSVNCHIKLILLPLLVFWCLGTEINI